MTAERTLPDVTGRVEPLFEEQARALSNLADVLISEVRRMSTEYLSRDAVINRIQNNLPEGSSIEYVGDENNPRAQLLINHRGRDFCLQERNNKLQILHDSENGDRNSWEEATQLDHYNLVMLLGHPEGKQLQAGAMKIESLPVSAGPFWGDSNTKIEQTTTYLLHTTAGIRNEYQITKTTIVSPDQSRSLSESLVIITPQGSEYIDEQNSLATEDMLLLKLLTNKSMVDRLTGCVVPASTDIPDQDKVELAFNDSSSFHESVCGASLVEEAFKAACRSAYRIRLEPYRGKLLQALNADPVYVISYLANIYATADQENSSWKLGGAAVLDTGFLSNNNMFLHVGIKSTAEDPLDEYALIIPPDDSGEEIGIYQVNTSIGEIKSRLNSLLRRENRFETKIDFVDPSPLVTEALIETASKGKIGSERFQELMWIQALRCRALGQEIAVRGDMIAKSEWDDELIPARLTELVNTEKINKSSVVAVYVPNGETVWYAKMPVMDDGEEVLVWFEILSEPRQDRGKEGEFLITAEPLLVTEVVNHFDGMLRSGIPSIDVPPLTTESVSDEDIVYPILSDRTD